MARLGAPQPDGLVPGAAENPVSSEEDRPDPVEVTPQDPEALLSLQVPQRYPGPRASGGHPLAVDAHVDDGVLVDQLEGLVLGEEDVRPWNPTDPTSRFLAHEPRPPHGAVSRACQHFCHVLAEANSGDGTLR